MNAVTAQKIWSEASNEENKKYFFPSPSLLIYFSLPPIISLPPLSISLFLSLIPFLSFSLSLSPFLIFLFLSLILSHSLSLLSSFFFLSLILSLSSYLSQSLSEMKWKSRKIIYQLGSYWRQIRKWISAFSRAVFHIRQYICRGRFNEVDL